MFIPHSLLFMAQVTLNTFTCGFLVVKASNNEDACSPKGKKAGLKESRAETGLLCETLVSVVLQMGRSICPIYRANRLPW